MGIKKKPIRIDIADQFEPFRNGFTHKCPYLYETLITDLNDYIVCVSKATEDTYLDHIAFANQALTALTWAGNPYGNDIELTHQDKDIIVAWDSKSLIELADTADWTTLYQYADKYGTLFLYYGYLTVFLVNVIRYDIDLRNKNTYDQTLIKFADVIIKESHSDEARDKNGKLINDALNRLNLLALNTFNKEHLPPNYKKLTPSQAEEFTPLTIQIVKNVVPDDKKEAMLHSAKGDKPIAFSQNKVAELYSDRYRKSELCNRWNTVLTYTPDKLELKEDPTSNPEIDLLRIEDQSNNNDMLNLVQQFINEPARLTEQQRKVCDMRYLQGRLIPFQEIADELGIGKTTVIDHHDAAIKKFRKLYGIVIE